MITLISGPTCMRCHFIKPHLEKYANDNWLAFEEIDISNATPEQIEGATMLPVIWINGEQVEYEKCVEMITKS